MVLSAESYDAPSTPRVVAPGSGTGAGDRQSSGPVGFLAAISVLYQPGAAGREAVPVDARGDREPSGA